MAGSKANFLILCFLFLFILANNYILENMAKLYTNYRLKVNSLKMSKILKEPNLVSIFIPVIKK